MKKYQCVICSYIYDPEKGDIENDVKPGTGFDNLPDEWACPECGSDRDVFEEV